MDFQPLASIPPLTRLLMQTLESFLSRGPTERLSAVVLDTVQVAALSEHAPHHHVLRTLRTKLEAVDASPGSAQLLLPVSNARRLLSGLHRFPVASTDQLYALTVAAGAASPSPPSCVIAETAAALAASVASLSALKESVEAVVVERHVVAQSAEAMSASDTQQLWAVVAQCTRTAHREKILSAFPQLTSAASSSPESWSAMLAQLSRAPSPIPFTSSCEDLLRDLFGAQRLWEHTARLYAAPQTTAAQRTQLTASMLSLSQALRDWPQDTPLLHLPPGHTVAAAAASSEAVTTLGASNLFIVAHTLHALHQPWVPESVRAATATALQDDLWRVYVERDVDGSVMFLLHGMSAWSEDVRRDVLANLHALHTAALARQAALQTGSVRAALRLDTYVAVLLVSALCEGDAALTATALQPYWVGLSTALQRSSSSNSSKPHGAAASEVSVRRVRPLLATYLSLLLECTCALSTSAAMPSDVQEAVAVLFAVCKKSLTCDVLQQRGSARVLCMLLAHAPTVTAQLSLRACAVALVHQHALTGGFTRQQLEALRPAVDAETKEASAFMARAVDALPRRSP